NFWGEVPDGEWESPEAMLCVSSPAENAGMDASVDVPAITTDFNLTVRNQDDIGWNELSGGPDIYPPDFTNNNMGSFSYCSTKIITITSNENCVAYCCEDGVGGCTSSTAIGSMDQFNTTGGLNHETLKILAPGFHKWWVRGKDGSDNVSDEVPCEHYITLTIEEEEGPPDPPGELTVEQGMAVSPGSSMSAGQSVP
ncbi:MAG TPA: hypothetical protein VMX95_10290, partial [Thermodesulfobacteriota bacterium]|nr:hypothetical protein [Thermodesulfobacteriota bacterium]